MLLAIFKKSPHLSSERELHEEAFILWKLRLRTYFKNTRSRTVAVPEILAKRCKYGKRKNDDNVDGVDQLHQTVQRWGLKNFRPQRHLGEDDKTIDAHIKVLQQQNRLVKSRQNNQLINTLMNKTFPERRQEIVTTMQPIRFVVEKYPIIWSEPQVMCSVLKNLILFVTKHNKYEDSIILFK